MIELVQQPWNQGQKVPILDGESIKPIVIDTYLDEAIIFIDKQDHGTN
jgi:hypothetical protein